MIVIAIKTVLVFAAYLFSFYIFGLLWNMLTKDNEPDMAVTMTAGMCIYSLAFMAYVIPLKISGVSLDRIAGVWAVIWCAGIALILVFAIRKKVFQLPFRRVLEFVTDNRLNALLFLGFNIAQILFVLAYGRWSGSTDPSEYVAYVTTSVFQNRLGFVDERTGLLREAFNTRIFTQTSLDHSAVISELTGLHPLFEIRWVTPVLYLVIGNLLLYFLAREICKNRAQQWLFFCVTEAALMIMTDSYLMQGFYYYFRNYEGKNYNCAVLLPVMAWVFWRLYHDPEDRKALRFGVLCAAGSYPFTGTTMFLVPVLCMGLLPAMVGSKRKIHVLADIVILSIPSIVYAGYYMAVGKGFISLAISP